MKERISYVELQVEIDEEYLKKCSTRSQLYLYAKEHKWTLFGGSFNSFKQALLNIDIDYSALPLNEHELRDDKKSTLYKNKVVDIIYTIKKETNDYELSRRKTSKNKTSTRNISKWWLHL